MVFHEITPEAIARALEQPRELDLQLVDAQESRRILDRLVGYEVSPCCGVRSLRDYPRGVCNPWPHAWWVDRERERMAFKRGVLLGRDRRVRQR